MSVHDEIWDDARIKEWRAHKDKVEKGQRRLRHLRQWIKDSFYILVGRL